MRSQSASRNDSTIAIDGPTVITGSFNFTKAAEEHNAENMLVIRDSAIAEKYRSKWDVHVEHSEPYKGRDGDTLPDEKPARKRKAA